MDVRPPQTQKAEARPISFLLDDRSRAGGEQRAVTLVIRPEDLTRTDPSRMLVQQTLGGAWADNFGAGLRTIAISGHTGWRRREFGRENLDGSERFEQLFDTVFRRWHILRNDAVSAGSDPDGVHLVFADALDGFAAIVAPTSFVLRRSKSRPLLMQYQITMTVISADIDATLVSPRDDAGPLQGSVREQSGLDSMLKSVESLTERLRGIQSTVDQTMVKPARDYLIKSIRLYNTVADAIRAGDDVAGSLITVARMTAQAGANAFRTVNAITSLPGHVRGRLMEIANAYTNILCVLRNAVQQQEFYPDYNPLFGASNCSSTSGGSPISPLSGINPFPLYTPANRSLPLVVSEGGQVGLKALAATDVVLAPMNANELVNSLSAASEGMVFA